MNFLKKCYFSALILSSASAFTLQETDRSAILEVIQNYTDSWNHKHGKGFGDGYSENADFVNIFGMKFSGRAEIESRHEKIIQSFFKDSKLEIMNTELREVQPGLVIATVYWKLNGFRTPGADISKTGDVRKGIYTQVFINAGKKWEITASQNTLMPEKM